jgi:hypothetical protein
LHNADAYKSPSIYHLFQYILGHVLNLSLLVATEGTKSFIVNISKTYSM